MANLFGNRSNQVNNGINVNTTIKTFFGDLSSLNIGAWNSQLSIKITPCTGLDANGMRNYDQNRRANTALTPENAKALKEGIDEIIKPVLLKLKNGEDVNLPINAAVSMGSNDKKNALAVEVKIDEKTGKPGVFLILYQMLGMDNTADPQNIFSYKFGEKSYVSNYDYRTGSVGGEHMIDSEFEVFYDILSKVADILPIAAHGVKYVNTLSVKFTPNTTAGNSYGNNNYGGNNSNFLPKPSYEAPVTTMMGSEDFGLPFN